MENELVLAINSKKYYIGFTTYLLMWMNTDKAEQLNVGTKRQPTNYQDLSIKIKVHELRLPLDPIEIELREGQSDIRRILFIEDDGIMSFGFICDEHASKKETYVALLEYSNYGINPVRAVLQAYAEYVTLIGSNWKLQIWAAPPSKKGEAYIFRNNPATKKEPADPVIRAKKLIEKYSAFFQLSGFHGKPFAIPFQKLPILPDFGKKAEENVRVTYAELEEGVNAKLSDFNNKYFSNTHCVELDLGEIPISFFPQLVTFKSRKTLLEYDYFANQESLDFSTEEEARKSTGAIIEKFKSYLRPAYNCIDPNNLRSNTKEYYKLVIQWIRCNQKGKLL